MNRYSEFSSCPKCGARRLAVSYDPHLDAMRRSCVFCGYKTVEAPLDKRAEQLESAAEEKKNG